MPRTSIYAFLLNIYQTTNCVFVCCFSEVTAVLTVGNVIRNERRYGQSSADSATGGSTGTG